MDKGETSRIVGRDPARRQFPFSPSPERPWDAPSGPDAGIPHVRYGGDYLVGDAAVTFHGFADIFVLDDVVGRGIEPHRATRRLERDLAQGFGQLVLVFGAAVPGFQRFDHEAGGDVAVIRLDRGGGAVAGLVGGDKGFVDRRVEYVGVV